MLEEALKKLDKTKDIKGNRERLMAPAVAAALRDFCRQDAEFAQAVAQGGSLQDCMTAVAKGVGGSLSDLEAYKRAVQFYFPGADVRMQLTIDLVGDADKDPGRPMAAPTDEGKGTGIVLNLEDFL